MQLRDNGRPQDVYFNGSLKIDHLKHEVLLTDFLLLYEGVEFCRLWDVDQQVRADAEMVLNGMKFFVELDTGEVSLGRVEKRWENYSGVSDYLLVVTSSETRLRNLVEHSSEVRGIALFTTLDEVKEEPYGEVWLDCFGKRVALPRPEG